MELISYSHVGFITSNTYTSLMDFDLKFRDMRFYTSKEQLRKVDMRNNCVWRTLTEEVVQDLVNTSNRILLEVDNDLGSPLFWCDLFAW